MDGGGGPADMVGGGRWDMVALVVGARVYKEVPYTHHVDIEKPIVVEVEKHSTLAVIADIASSTTYRLVREDSGAVILV